MRPKLATGPRRSKLLLLLMMMMTVVVSRKKIVKFSGVEFSTKVTYF
jgi:hypothetical protein